MIASYSAREVEALCFFCRQGTVARMVSLHSTMPAFRARLRMHALCIIPEALIDRLQRRKSGFQRFHLLFERGYLHLRMGFGFLLLCCEQSSALFHLAGGITTMSILSS